MAEHHVIKTLRPILEEHGMLAKHVEMLECSLRKLLERLPGDSEALKGPIKGALATLAVIERDRAILENA